MTEAPHMFVASGPRSSATKGRKRLRANGGFAHET